MPSRILPIEEIEHLGTKFWLPAGGRENGVEATAWAVLAELESGEVSPVLSKLAAAHIAGYAATIAGAAPRGNARHRLYVDAMQYNQASDALMIVLRGRENRDLGGYVPRRRPAAEPASTTTTSARPSVAAMARRVGQCILIAATFAVLLAVGYEIAPHRFPVVHSRAHHEQYAPGIHQPAAPSFP